MNKLYIFGDSFSITTGRRFFKTSWITQLDKKYQLINLSKGGASCSYIFNQLISVIDQITSDDVVILGWSDQNRDFHIDKNIQQQNYEHLLISAKDLLTKRSIKHLVFWSFPNEYSKKINWCDPRFDHIHHSEYDYAVRYNNEIIPALIYFSKQEVLGKLTSSEKQVNHYMNDHRPNHIADQKIHNELFRIVDEFIKNKINGHINLDQRLSNGS